MQNQIPQKATHLLRQLPGWFRKFGSGQRTRVFVIAIGSLLLFDLLLLAALNRSDDIVSRDSRTVRLQIDRASEATGRPVLLIGDSVLAGNVLASSDALWQKHRVLDFLRNRSHADEPRHFFQLATDGLLPVDMERIVAELEARDPARRVSVAIELNLRHFSPTYVEQEECSREFYCDLPTAPGGDLIARLNARWTGALDTLRSLVPILRLRPWLYPEGFFGSGLEAETITPPTSSPERENDLTGLARLRGHYDYDPGEMLAGSSAQVQAFRRLLVLLQETGRPALVFAPPLEDRFAAGIGGPEALAERYALLSELVQGLGGPGVHFVAFDHPVFDSDYFVDHIHLTAAGNELLAENLLLVLGARFSTAPEPGRLIYERSGNRTLLTSAELPGSRDGPPWWAALNHPDGIAFDANDGAPRLIIADTGNHVVRAIRTDFGVLETIAGRSGEPGHSDTESRDLSGARFEAPRVPVVADDGIYLIDGDGSRLRVIQSAGAIRFVHTLAMPGTTRALDIASRGKDVLVLASDGFLYVAGMILNEGAPRRLRATGIPGATRLTSGKNDQVFITNGQSIYRLTLTDDEPAELLLSGRGDLFVGNLDRPFPLPFERARFVSIQRLVYVPAYDGLLVADEIALQSGPDDDYERATERLHLRFVHPASRRVFPWLALLTNNEGHFPRFRNNALPGSFFHLGSLALNPTTNQLYVLERERTRLTSVGDGLLAAAQTTDVGNVASPFSDRMAPEVRSRFNPFRHLSARSDSGAPYSLVYVGSSLANYTDAGGNYALYRAVAARLERSLMLESGVRTALFGVIQPGAHACSLPEIAESYLDSEDWPDILLLEVNAAQDYHVRKLQDPLCRTRTLELARRLQAAGSALVLIDLSGLGQHSRSGLHRIAAAERFLDELEAAGLQTVRPTSSLLPDLNRVYPWGTPPFRPYDHHGSIPAIEATARALARALTPLVAEHARTHAALSDRRPDAPVSRQQCLTDILDDGLIQKLETVSALPRTALTVRLYGTHLEALVDTTRVGSDSSAPILLRAMRSLLLDDSRANLATSLKVRQVRFFNYDEYGQGVLESALELQSHEFQAESLKAYLREAF